MKPGVHTNDFAPIYGRRVPKLGHESLATVLRSSRLIFHPILRENLESPVLRYQPITTAVIPDACLRESTCQSVARKHFSTAIGTAMTRGYRINPPWEG